MEFVFRRWLKGVVGVHGWNKKEAIGYAAYELREQFMKQLPVVNLDPSELSLVCASARLYFYSTEGYTSLLVLSSERRFKRSSK